MTNKRVLLFFSFIFCICSTTFLVAQSESHSELRKREIGLRLHGLDNFGVIYKYQVKENKYRRFKFASGNISVQDNTSTNFETSFSAGFGSEKRIPIADKAKLLHGPEFNGGFTIRTNASTTIISLSPGASYLLGFLYQPNDNFNISLEGSINLSTTYQFVSGNRDWLDFAAVSLQFNSSNIALNLVYCFESKIKAKKTSKKRDKNSDQN